MIVCINSGNDSSYLFWVRFCVIGFLHENQKVKSDFSCLVRKNMRNPLNIDIEELFLYIRLL